MVPARYGGKATYYYQNWANTAVFGRAAAATCSRWCSVAPFRASLFLLLLLRESEQALKAKTAPLSA
jgi:hypothetical protein